jgi:ribosome-associated protein
MIQVNRNIAIDENEIELDFIRSSGPGGQNVNKVSTGVQLRYNVAGSTSLPESVRQRLKRKEANRINNQGILIIESREHRSQERNRQAAIERLIEMIRAAARKPKVRKKTRPTAASRERRLESKRRHSQKKKLRRRVRYPQE